MPKAQGIINDANARRPTTASRSSRPGSQLDGALMEVPSNAVMSSKIKGYIHLPHNVSYFDDVWLAPDGRRLSNRGL